MAIERVSAASRYGGLALLTAALFAIAWLLTRHAGHLWAFLPYAFLAACPLMHLLHHGRHGRRRGGAAAALAIPDDA